jgi:hypothetical protein
VSANSLVLRRVRGIFDGDPRRSPPLETAQDQIDALRGPLDDDDLLRVGDHTTRATETVGKHLAQSTLSARLR